jgi:TrmH family RNA methyltransferase
VVCLQEGDNVREISSVSNPYIKHLRALATSKKARQESGSFLIEGWRGIDTLLRHESRRYTLESLVISSEWINDPRLPESVDTMLLSDHLIEKVSDVNNAQGILGVVRHTPCPFEYHPDTGRYLLLDNLRDPGNLGTLIRSAVGAGFDGILLYGDCVEPFNPKVIRSTMGTFAFADLWNVDDDELEELTAHGYEMCATTGRDGQSLYETKFGMKTILAIGSEAHGLSDALMQRAAKKITIPLAEECESLNAAIAGSICMFQITKGQ